MEEKPWGPGWHHGLPQASRSSCLHLAPEVSLACFLDAVHPNQRLNHIHDHDQAERERPYPWEYRQIFRRKAEINDLRIELQQKKSREHPHCEQDHPWEGEDCWQSVGLDSLPWSWGQNSNALLENSWRETGPGDWCRHPCPQNFKSAGVGQELNSLINRKATPIGVPC